MSEEYRSDRTNEHLSDEAPRRSPKILATLAAILCFTGILGCLLPIAIWPGEAKLTAPLFCDAPYTEPIVVSDTFHDSEGRSTNYSLYCVGERGEYTEVGFLRPWLALWALHTVIVIILVMMGRAWRWWRPAKPAEPAKLTESTEL
ncbi:hypothetical protein ACFYV7_24180 [Nocardia suismassiliense]|uniref:Transmembrane protein n=1 Tax=Nocardia suismassiliense TaxID=2077092 RepID=A0ABW6QXC8_9NOCA